MISAMAVLVLATLMQVWKSPDKSQVKFVEWTKRQWTKQQLGKFFTCLVANHVFPKPFGPKKCFSFCTRQVARSVMSTDSLEGKSKSPLEIEGLFKDWESDAAIRAHLHEDGSVLFGEKFTETVKTVASKDHIYALLIPLLQRMSLSSGAPQPAIEPLRHHLSELYKFCKKEVDYQQVVLDSWMTRKCLALVKKKVRLSKPSTVTRLEIDNI